MLPCRVGLISQSDSVKYADVVRVAQALNIQVYRDLTPLWNVSGNVAALETADNLDPGIWPVYIVDEVPSGTTGFHLTEHNQPYAVVQSGSTWSLSASHEVLEMFVDPSGNRLASSSAVHIVDNEVQDADGKMEYLVEVCDPAEDAEYAYLIDDVLVSDFYTPHYFDPAGTSAARYSFSGRISRPREVLPNGYLTWFDSQTNTLKQVRHFGAPEIVSLGKVEPGGGSLTGGRSLRTFVDAMTPPPRKLSKIGSAVQTVEQRDARRLMFASAAPVRAHLFSAAFASTLKSATVKADASQAAAGDEESARAALANHQAEFGKPGVLSVRPGVRWSMHSSQPQHVIVVTASQDTVSALRAALPATVDGVPVDVREADVMQTMRVINPSQYLALANARHELRQPDFTDEVFFDGQGNVLQEHPAPLAAFAAAHPGKEHITYTKAPGFDLDAVESAASLVLHASPDAGWEQLSGFLAGIKKDLVVGMYDFTSAHILTALEQALDGGKSLTLTLDHPAKNPSADQTDEETQSDLSQKLANKFEGTWALTNADPKAPVWIYPNAYHIKVAVREDDTFWLSSGNWNNSNQPEIDLGNLPAARKLAATHDRDWHVIVTNKQLADKFRGYLQHDFDVASNEIAKMAGQAAASDAAKAHAQLEVPLEALAAGRTPRQFFPAQTVSGSMKIQPLLTPDNYQPLVKQLIESAQRTFYMQTQYIHPSDKPGDADHEALIEAVKELIDKGIDVRLITSQFQTDDWVEKVTGAGIPPSVLRRQANVHNKGIVVDSSIVMVSSQNWSADGTLRNRDAGLIIYNTDAAAYFEQIFIHDWNNLASPIAT
jgi:phosphatidylserine/phosphatidylglycerophosphate/cardiolipin synthase-like enzyme